jgi:cell volume regulation protein A
MAAGSEGFGGIPFDDHQLAFRLGTLALVLILFDGGLDTPRQAFRAALGRATVLATAGVVLTAALAAAIAWLVGLPPALAVLVGAVASSTDAAAVFSVLRGSHVRLRGGTAATIEVESGLNDPVAMILTVAATEAVLGPQALDAFLLASAVRQLAIGAAVGWLAGSGGSALLRAVRLGAPGLYPMLTLAIALASFGLATLAGGSGFLAVYLAGIVLGAGPLPYRAGVKRVHDGFAWLSQLGMFLMLGLLVFPSRLLPTALPGLVLALGFAVAARPLAVLASLALFPGPWRERLFVAWVGLRGAVPIVLATYRSCGSRSTGRRPSPARACRTCRCPRAAPS